MKKGRIVYSVDKWLHKSKMFIEKKEDIYYHGYVFNKYGKVYVEVPVEDVEVLN